MKRFLTTILALIYLSTSIGATVHLHYCMGKLVNWDFRQAKSHKCSKCGMDKLENSGENGCCKDEFKKIKNEKDQKTTETTLNLINHSHSVILSQIELAAINISPIAEANPVSNAPPRSELDIYIRNCVFLV